MFLVPIPRTVAKERGLKHYDSTSFCKFGNISKRLVSNFTCLCNSCKKEKYSKVKDYKKNS